MAYRLVMTKSRRLTGFYMEGTHRLILPSLALPVKAYTSRPRLAGSILCKVKFIRFIRLFHFCTTGRTKGHRHRLHTINAARCPAFVQLAVAGWVFRYHSIGSAHCQDRVHPMSHAAIE